jgi:hypothetical protein
MRKRGVRQGYNAKELFLNLSGPQNVFKFSCIMVQMILVQLILTEHKFSGIPVAILKISMHKNASVKQTATLSSNMWTTLA